MGGNVPGEWILDALASPIDVEHPVFDSRLMGDAIRYKFEGRPGRLESFFGAGLDKHNEIGCVYGNKPL